MSKLADLAKKIVDGVVPMSPKELAEERIKMCESCQFFKKMTRQCALCGCFMDVKTKMLEASCPAGKW